VNETKAKICDVSLRGTAVFATAVFAPHTPDCANLRFQTAFFVVQVHQSKRSSNPQKNYSAMEGLLWISAWAQVSSTEKVLNGLTSASASNPPSI
jgi:hypothetical protein